ncbi:RiPP maturation radical SAM C-methyltransferase [Actinopolyspora saharensis]|uniref:Ribosomal peptide maturation radical SAM protein 1 n=1 Tax=Actinopolyspora saharensis TaxID=995062 RepID=A0A1H1EH38_9ACTN|nr:RiPP maturation radical SAM C-methyltransferase [Actinopolyspora saharensis]SDQ87759.1 ribosomal peptide maturation radical SAM protein 1 [Actinopolyspora saharensis]
MRTTLINMPWASVEYPSLACGILKSTLESDSDDESVRVLNANIDFFDWVHDRMGLGVSEYDFFALESYFQGCGDWVFSAALYGLPEWRVPEFLERRRPEIDSDRLDLCVRLHRHVGEWIRGYAAEIATSDVELVGFSTTFQQNTASLALARELKRRRPELLVVFGGANCDGAQGAAWHRNFEFVDHVVRGEGESAFPRLVGKLERGEDLSTVPGLCWRDEVGKSVVNAMTAAPVRPSEIVAPDFDGYLERFHRSTVSERVEPKLVLEGARGCWWGEKHHCTFCGLNGSFMEFRSKTPERFYAELVDLTSRYQVLDVYLVDNILDMEYLRTVLPWLSEAGWDLRIQCEIKSNLRYEQLRDLVRAGVVQVQPGIESLSSRVLGIMNKGVGGCQNVRMLRDAGSLGMTVMWNLLYGFPGEREEDYTAVLRQFPALVHLPPMDGASRIALERFSPYFDDPQLGFEWRIPEDQYFITYDLPERELEDLAYLFTTVPAGIVGETEKGLLEAVRHWSEAHPGSWLKRVERDGEIVVLGQRSGFGCSELVLSDPFETELFRALEHPRSVENLVRRFGRDAELRDKLDEWVCAGIVFTESDDYVHVVPEDNNQELLRL